MDEIGELRNRIGKAFAVIAEGIEQLEPAGRAGGLGQADTAELAVLRAAFDEERVVQAQLEERVRALKDRLDRKSAEMDAAAAAARAEMAALDHALQGLRQSNADLRDIVSQLRAALVAQVADPALVNRAMLAEIEALRAGRSADLAEIEAVYGALRPLIGETM